MATRKPFGKNDLIDFIQDSIRQYGGLNPQMMKELESVIKAQIEMNDASDYIKDLQSGNEDIRRLLEDVLDGKDVRTKPKVEVKVSGKTTSTEDTSGTEEVIDRADKTFRQVLEEDIRNNKRMIHLNTSAMKDAMGDAIQSTSNAIGSRVDNILGEEKTNVIDPLIDVSKGIYGIGKGMKNSFTIEMREQDKMYSIQEDQYDIAKQSKQTLDDTYSVLDKAYSKSMNDDMVEETNKKLDDIYKIQEKGLEFGKEEALRDQRERDKLSWFQKMGIAAVVGLVLGAMTGAIVGAILKPFAPLGHIFKAISKKFSDAGASAETAGSTMEGVANEVRKRELRKAGKLTLTQKMMRWFGERLAWIKKLRFFRWIGTIVDNLKGVFRSIKLLTRIQTGLLTVGSIFETGGEVIKKLFLNVFTAADDIEEGITWFSKVVNWFKRLPIIGEEIGEWLEMTAKGIEWVKNAVITWYNGTTRIARGFRFVGDIIRKISNVVGFFIKAIKNFPVHRLGMFLNAFKIGFAAGMKWLALPLRIIMSMVDFMKGYMGSSETSMVGKIKDGVISMIHGILDLPAMLLGWLWDKALNIFGIESKGTAGKMVEWIDQGLHAVFDPLIHIFDRFTDSFSNIFGGFFGAIGNFVSMLWNLVTLDFSGVSLAWDAVLDNILKFFKGLVGIFWNMPVVGWGKTMWGWIKDALTGTIFDPIIQLLTKLGDWIGGIWDSIKDKLSKTWLIGDLFKGEETNRVERDAKITEKIEKLKEKRSVASGKLAKLNADPQLGVVGWTQKKWHEDTVEDVDAEIADLKKQLSTAPDTIVEKAKKPFNIKGGIGDALKGAKNVYEGGKVQFRHLTGGDDVSSYTAPIDNPSSLAPMVQSSDRIAQNIASEQQQLVAGMDRVTESIKTMSKETIEKADRPIVVNTGGGNRRDFEPPTDIEAMSILFVNKSWGLG